MFPRFALLILLVAGIVDAHAASRIERVEPLSW